MVESAHLRLSTSAQCRLLRISRSSYYSAPMPEIRAHSASPNHVSDLPINASAPAEACNQHMTSSAS